MATVEVYIYGPRMRVQYLRRGMCEVCTFGALHSLSCRVSTRGYMDQGMVVVKGMFLTLMAFYPRSHLFSPVIQHAASNFLIIGHCVDYDKSFNTLKPECHVFL